MSGSIKQLIANCANALKVSSPKTGHFCAPVCPPYCPASPNPGQAGIAYILKNEETNPFCRPSPACPTHFPATNKQKVIMVLRAAEFLKPNPFLSVPRHTYDSPFFFGFISPAHM